MVSNLVMITALVVLWTAMGLESGVDDGRWLQQLYTATGGGGWNDTFPGDGGLSSCNSGWNMTAGANPCSGRTSLWNIRVGCNSNGRVHQVDLGFCNLRGTLPELDSSSGGAMSQLQHMSLSNNQLSGPLPASWGNLSSLQRMSLSNNQLSGPLPASWGNLSSLQHMSLSNNQLSGPLPALWSELSSLQIVSLAVNILSSTLPASWNSLRSLQYLWLSGNQLNGSLPASWSSLASLQKVYLSNNQLDGTLPASWSGLSSLQYMFFESNQLSGSLPASWSSLSSLQELSLNGNQLNGTLPGSWSRMGALVNLSLIANFLSGYVPESWSSSGMLSSLSHVDVRLNCLNLSSALSNAAQWSWLLSKTSFGAGLVLQRTSCYCDLGQLSTYNGYWCEDCPAGYYCPNTSTSMPCPAGTYNPYTGKSNASDACLACPTGTTSNVTGQNSSRSCNISTDFDTSATGLSSVSIAAVIAGLPIALLSRGGSVGTVATLQRSLLQLRLSFGSTCATDLDAPLDPSSSPTQLEIDGGSVGAFIRGAVIGNVLLLLGCGCCAVGIAILLHRRRPSSSLSCSRAGRSLERGWRSAATTIRLPGLLATPFLFLLQPTMSSSLGCLVSAPLAAGGAAANLSLGFVGCGACVAGLQWCTMRVLRVRGACEAVRRRRRPLQIHSVRALSFVVVDWMFAPSSEWRNRFHRGPAKYFLQQYGALFDGYRGGRQWFLCVEMAISIACGVISFLQSVPGLGDSAASCRALVGALTSVNVIALLCVVMLRPYQRGWELLMFGASNALGVAWGAVSLLADNASAAPEQIASVQVWLQVVQLGFVLVEMLWHRLNAVLRRPSPEIHLEYLSGARPSSSPASSRRRLRRHRHVSTHATEALLLLFPSSCVPQQFLSDPEATCESLIRLICEQRPKRAAGHS